ncbi:adenylate/guanylate cyclase domain-containing protein [Mycolicibacterium sp. KC 300]|uniref:Adenylate/guanylate cyclase domain-containing protein n=1 Tax=Mycolicibacterium arseniciresistens TaxID=3062257 RepID=A0ABT8UHE0_9MYCO|nr:adenylate/guanylate cyclase domain-containing protein [Mycolicibacterium arseniciresistens]
MDAVNVSDHAAVAFLDLAGFTALTAVRGDQEAADLAEQFAALTTAALGPDDRLVKTLGDGLLLTSPTAPSALALVRRVIELCTHTNRFPVLRGGIHYGPIVQRHNDIYGHTVNLAARVAEAAVNGQILLTQEVAAAARDEGLTVTEGGPTRFRNITAPVDVFALDLDCLCPRVDPVCRVLLQPGTAATTIRYQDLDYDFCSPECAQLFDASPQIYADAIKCAADGP